MRSWHLPALALLGLALLLLPTVLDSYSQYIVNLGISFIVATTGLNILLGYAGQFAFANAAFMGIGAYMTALLSTRLGWSYFLTLPLSAVATAILGFIVARPTLRMNTVYLAMVSLAFAQLVVWTLTHWKSVTLGTDGVSLRWPSLLGFRVQGDQSTYYIFLAVALAVYCACARVLRSKWGRSFVAIRENEIMAACSGINVARTKGIAFAISAFCAALGGGLFALSLRFIVPDGFGLLQLVLHFSMALIGGLGHMFGPVFGALILTALPELLRGLQAFQEIIYGLILIVFILFMPRGIAGLLMQCYILRPEILVRDPELAERDFLESAAKFDGSPAR